MRDVAQNMQRLSSSQGDFDAKMDQYLYESSSMVHALGDGLSDIRDIKKRVKKATKKSFKKRAMEAAGHIALTGVGVALATYAMEEWGNSNS